MSVERGCPVGKFKVLRDTREKERFGWTFEPDKDCLGTETVKLDTGDYTIRGLESVFTIERKLSLSEIYNNIVEKRFYRELERLREFQYGFIVMEFSFEDIFTFPNSSGIPRHKWHLLRMDYKQILCKLMEIERDYPTKLIFAGRYSKDTAYSIIKRISEKVVPVA